MSLSVLKDLLKDYQEITKNPEKYINIQDESKSHETAALLKNLYDFTKNSESKTIKSDALPELIVENFDLEQIWQQIELQNEGFLTRSILNVSKLVVNKDKLVFKELENDLKDREEVENNEEENKEHHSDESSDDDDDDDQDPLVFDKDSNSDELSLNSEDNFSDEDKGNKNIEVKKKPKPSVVDDQFFKLDEMEEFLKSEEKRTNSKEDDSGNDSETDENEDVNDEIDYFENDSDGSDDMETNDKERGGSRNPKYKDFFGEADESVEKVKRNKFLEEEEEEEERQNANVKSSFELREERLRNKIEHLEEAAVQEKSWQLKGEITAEGRPQNSLLEEIVDFDLTTRPAPVMTEQTTMQLEDVIRQRIKDKAFDSVERKQKPTETPLEYKKKLVLNQEKSKESLAQIYEKEFLEQKEALNPDASEKEEVEPPLHIEIKKMMNALFYKLDSLSNFHFTPKAAAPDLKVVSNLPAITMEEVAPIATSDAALLAPEEVKRKIKGDIIGKSERTDTDKKRERRKKKLKQHKHALIQQKKELKKVSLGITNKYTKEKAKKMLDKVTKDKNVDKMEESNSKKIKSSTAFFTQLEDEIKTQIKGKTRKLTRKDDNNKMNAKKLKL